MNFKSSNRRYELPQLVGDVMMCKANITYINYVDYKSLSTYGRDVSFKLVEGCPNTYWTKSTSLRKPTVYFHKIL